VKGIHHPFLVVINSKLTAFRIPALFLFILTAQNQLEFAQTFQLGGNALAVVTDMNTTEVIASVDKIHKPGSTTEQRENANAPEDVIQVLEFEGGNLVQSNKVFAVLTQGDSIPEYNTSAGKFTNLLYNIENLRKREGDGQDE
jgi:tRNA (guanine-N(7)-)-methyltransferase subunit TRM82